jgi:excisionase family DNA binding protein
MEKVLLTLQEVCEYTGLGKTKVREILKRPESTFTVRIGNRLYANKVLLDAYLEKCAKYQINI